MQKARIGFIGLGAMGAGMAANLVRAGFPVTVHNRTREREEPFAELGAERAGSPAGAVADADIAITIVSDVPDVKEVICGPGGVLSGIRTGKIVIDMSTIGPKAAREIAEACAQVGVRFLDAPVSGGPSGAADGTMAIMVGGDEDAFRQAMPVFEAMGKTIVHFGPAGAGQAVKLVNQVFCVANFVGVAEGLLLAERLGLDRGAVIPALAGGAAGSWMLAHLGPKMAARDFEGGFKVNLQAKDLRLVLESAGELGLPMPLTRVVLLFLKSIQARGHGDWGTQSAITAYEEMAGAGKV